MADCSYARCMQERRTIKKHLQKWTKNCVYTLGFERVAEEFMGRRKWRLYQENVLRSWCPSIEREIEIKDWDPNEDKCSFCDLEPTGKLTEDEPISPLRSEYCVATGHINNNNKNNNHIELLEGDASDSNSESSVEDSAMNTVDSVAACQAAIAALPGSGGAPNPLLYPPGVFPNWYLARPPKSLLEGIVKNEPPPMVMNLLASAGSEMPLDLSAKSSKPPPQPLHNTTTTTTTATTTTTTAATESPDSIRLPNIMDSKPLIRGRSRMSPMSGRRAYTEDELQAALRDIQSGKLGTRRAAVIYGIPRSTLRNKVYKLALERERDAHLLLAPRPSPPDGAASSPSLSVNPDKEDSSADDEKEPDSSKQRFSMEDLLRLSAAADKRSHAEGLSVLLHNISRLHSEGTNSKDVLSSENSVLGTYLSQLLKLKENVSPENEEEKPFGREDVCKKKDGDESAKESEDAASQDSEDKAKYSSHLLPELMRQIMNEQRLLIEEQLKRKITTGENGLDDDQSNVILRIPSFKPNASCSKSNSCEPEACYSTSPAGASQENSRQSVASPSLNGDSDSSPGGKSIGSSTLRDAIVKGIGHKFQQDGIGRVLASPCLGQDAMDALAKRGGFSHLSLPPHHQQQQQSILKNHFERNQQRPQHGTGPQSNSQGKGTRPKRGKYRNYDRDSLVEAVRAVQRGEMSVHRAGSYYGVPHSTLEYKVKERHLMRPRKREPKGEDKTKLQPSTGTASAATASEKPKQLPLAPKPASTKASYPAALANGLKIPSSIFETGVSPLAAYAGAPFPFWPPTPFHPLPLDISRGAFPPTPEQLFAPQMMRGGIDAPSSPSTLPPTARRIAESLYDGSGSNGSFLDGIIRSSLEMGLTASQKHDKDSDKSKSIEKMSNKALLDQLCRNSRLAPVPPRTEVDSDDEGGGIRGNVPYDLSRISDDDLEGKRTSPGSFESEARRASDAGKSPGTPEEKNHSEEEDKEDGSPESSGNRGEEEDAKEGESSL